ncbi:MAG: YifB family Mg chelatase-like AAA ATPase [Caldilineales bacterium]
MLAKVLSCSVIGLEGTPIEVEVDIYDSALPSIVLVGLPDAAVKESTERVRAALFNSALYYPRGRVTINLAPADLRKVGPVYDLPIAVGLMAASNQITPATLEQSLFIGELSLDGSLRHIDGVLPMAYMAQQQGIKTVYLPATDAPEAALIPGLDVIPVASLAVLVSHLRDFDTIPPFRHSAATRQLEEALYTVDFADIKGQEHIKRALEVAAAGAHNCLMTGSPGAGKTLMARSLPSILPKLNLDEALDITRIYSVTGQLPPGTPLVAHRPFRAPHHTISNAGLVGGGRLPRPGEISLAHRGVLFLDEMPEFGPANLETLRQPMEDKVVTISRAQGSLSFPANFMLIGAMNPCPCGWYGDTQHDCTCSPAAVSKYQKRLSGPLLDRIDIHVEVPRVDFEKLSDTHRGESSRAIRTRVEAARARQRERFADYAEGHGALLTNADMGPGEIREFCAVDEAGHSLLRAAMRQLHMSARAYHRTLKLARTIADLAGVERIETAHLAEAIQYRPRWQV